MISACFPLSRKYSPIAQAARGQCTASEQVLRPSLRPQPCSHRAVIGRRLHNLGHRGAFLADRTIDANRGLLGVADDGVEHDGGADLAVADDQFALAAADRDHAVVHAGPGGHGFSDRLAIDDARSKTLDGKVVAGRNRPLVVDWLAERIHHAADHGVADRHAQDLARPLDLVSLALRGCSRRATPAYLVSSRFGQAGDLVRELERSPYITSSRPLRVARFRRRGTASSLPRRP